MWLLSPLGGQATYRTFSDQDHQLRDHPLVDYPNMNWTEAYFPGYTTSISELYQMSSKTTFFAAAVFGSPSVKHSKVDLWRNAKVPHLERLEENGIKASDGWIDVDGEENIAHSSLLGVPLGNLPDSSAKDVSTSLTINTTYWALDSQRSMQSDFTNLSDYYY
ncbi:hypothetical protein BFW01_g2541 [Lasiodiplodia theobromae]|nr:hypothetical protein BFW01_g2541 [Lasiodiplodia theobromae]